MKKIIYILFLLYSTLSICQKDKDIENISSKTSIKLEINYLNESLLDVNINYLETNIYLDNSLEKIYDFYPEEIKFYNYIPNVVSIESSISDYFHSKINVIEQINKLFYFSWIEINTIEDYRFASY